MTLFYSALLYNFILQHDWLKVRSIIQVHQLRQEVSSLEKSLENRHTDVTDKDMLEQIDSSQPVTMQGYLFKRTTNAFKTWNRRYFTLQNNQLVYRKRSGEVLHSVLLLLLFFLVLQN